MTDNDGAHVGARIAYYRKRRGLLQQGLAMRANVSKSLLSKVECGQRPASKALIAACARALNVTPADLLGQPYADELNRAGLEVVIQPLRIAMENWDVPLDWETRPRPVALIRSDVDQALEQRRQAKYLEMAQSLPGLMDECVHAVHTTTGEERRIAYECLAGTYRCVFTLAWALGYLDLATVAVGRLAWAAPLADEPAFAALHAYIRSQTNMGSGRYDLGMRVVDRALRDLDRVDSRRPVGLQAMRGMLHLRAAEIAGRAADPDLAEVRLAEAGGIARQTGEVPDWGMTFGPTNVGVHGVAIAVDLYEFGQAVDRAQDVRIPRGWTKSRAGHHWMDLAKAHAWAGDAAAALDCLARARRAAPQLMRYHPTTRETVVHLRKQERVRSGPLADLAGWIGLP
ncbi:helix-turn-helix transcriptional regulator [Streptomyces sp. DSM 44917]|uniref:Helix-turn-helix transcriptional regulator n=1 Tax=Streptomyces boetiae TaxID=3075541 RepID=A0ABU2L9W9_9ACTN|nr:helix-turn-helix transcriptional regulator [Streptomyces sp. DSM 44917]MDT0308276.1 helix-turn-helix transcriptional regulator [Streptomyces sp. DSM 44917]